MQNTVNFDTMEAVLLFLIHRDTILVGHDLENDLIGLKIYHGNIIDTSQVFGFSQSGKASLKYLIRKYLRRQIQLTEHDSL